MTPSQKTVGQLMRRLSTHPRKRLSQNFMISEHALESIVAALRLDAGGNVLEIGAGLGFLTRELLKKTPNIIAVEKDKRFCGYLQDAFAVYPGLRIIQSDILDFDFAQLGRRPAACVGNIPYQITSPLVEVLTRERRRFVDVLLTMQKEVAVRLIAKAGDKNRSSFSCWLEMHAEIEIVKQFQKSDFYPEPRVDSSLVRLNFFDEPRYPAESGSFLKACLRRSFQKKRKNILNAIQSPEMGLSKTQILESLEHCDIPYTQRPEDLKMEDWVQLADHLRSRIMI